MWPKLVDLGPFPIHTYGVLLATALFVGIWLAARLGEEDGIPPRLTWDLGFVVVLSGIVGAKLLLVITEFHYYAENPGRLFSLQFLQAGGVYYGGFLGAVAGAAWFLRKHPELSFWRVSDAAAPAIALGQAIGRLGCFSAGCDYGCPTEVPWAVVFTSEYAHQVVGTPLHVPLHPYQLYESAGCLALFLLLWWAYSRRTFFGQIFCFYLIGYGLLRFFLEFFRGDLDRGFVFGGLLSTSQFISVLIVPAGVLAYFRLRRHYERLNQRARDFGS